MQDKSEKASPVNTKNGFVRNTLQTSTRKIYRNRKKPERKTQREGPKKTRFFRPDLPIRPITGFFRKNSGVEKSRNLPRPLSSEKRHRPTPSEHRKMTLHLAGGIFFAIFVKDRRRFGNCLLYTSSRANPCDCSRLSLFLEQAAWRSGMKNKFVRFMRSPLSLPFRENQTTDILCTRPVSSISSEIPTSANRR